MSSEIYTYVIIWGYRSVWFGCLRSTDPCSCFTFNHWLYFVSTSPSGFLVFVWIPIFSVVLSFLLVSLLACVLLVPLFSSPRYQTQPTDPCHAAGGFLGASASLDVVFWAHFLPLTNPLVLVSLLLPRGLRIVCMLSQGPRGVDMLRHLSLCHLCPSLPHPLPLRLRGQT